MRVQLTRFGCGGLVVGATADHRVADGQSMSTFFTAWASCVRGFGVSPLPVFDRLTYTCEFLKKLKSRLPPNYSTFSALLGHVWIYVSVNGRPRLKLPHEFFGNALQCATAQELLKGGAVEVATRVRDSVRCVNESYLRSFIDYRGVYGEGELLPMMTDNDKDVFLCPDLEVVSWLGFRFHEKDFGGGGLVGFGPTWVEAEGFVAFIPGLGGGGGGDDVDVVVVMFEEHAEVMKRISHCMD
ncbi:Agmatine coumaroyltransferase-2 [Acorus gramineus]|uniref:Agmatine coumaroyltransferase-2 n=1 Tax=Acorus gramineus TaxID=55184 RepID=A0AAV9BPI6_ACOGR|nr:Agmatine coumaroyltransferase-2 [Acorus gramineus]